MRLPMFIGLLLSSTITLGAQPSMLAYQPLRVAEQSAPRAGKALATKVTLDLRAVPVKTALHEIARQAALDIVFGDDIARHERLVTLRVKDVPASQALATALQGTGIGYRMFETGKLIFSTSENSVSGRQGIIVGKVINAKTKQPIAGATVTLEGVSGDTKTSDDGTFRLPASPGQHTVRVRAVGFGRGVHTVTVVGEQTSEISVVLEPSASVLDQVIVTGTVVATERKEIPTPITVITGDEIARRGITRIDQLLRGEVPGVLAIDAGSQRFNGVTLDGNDTLGAMVQSQVFARGNASLVVNAVPTPLKTYVDGIELLDPSFLGTIDPQSIERIEIITGPQAATIYGSGALGGVMQIFTKRGAGGQQATFQLGIRYGMLQNNISAGRTPQHNHVLNVNGGLGDGLSYSANLSHQYQGQWQPDLFYRQSGFSAGAMLHRGEVSFSGNVALTGGRNGTIGTSYLNTSPLYASYVSTGVYIPSSGVHPVWWTRV